MFVGIRGNDKDTIFFLFTNTWHKFDRPVYYNRIYRI